MLQRGLGQMAAIQDLRLLEHCDDLLGPWCLALAPSAARPAELKAAAVRVEAASAWARLLDIDVYEVETGSTVDRASLGLAPRACLLCGEPAHGCARSRRHDPEARARRVRALLAEALGQKTRGQALANALRAGALAELELSPKPGLVDREGSGSHQDLDLASMQNSVALLPRYFDELLEACERSASLPELAGIGRDAEARMWRAIGANAHAGAIFLGGLLLAALPEAQLPCDAGPPAIDSWRRRIRELAGQHFASAPAPGSHGDRARERYGVGGIAGEALAGLPLLFGELLDRYRASMLRGEGQRRAGFRVMALGMQLLEDTTALHRCGEAGLARVRSDGAELAALLDDDAAWPERVEARLRELDGLYRQLNLTMGGVADQLALTFALWQFFEELGGAGPVASTA